MPYSDKMKIRIEDIIFWIIVAIIVAIVIWILSGSPPIENSLPSLTSFIIASEVLLWRTLYKIDKKTSNGFIKMKNNLNNLEKDIKNSFNEVNKRLINIENLIKKK